MPARLELGASTVICVLDRVSDSQSDHPVCDRKSNGVRKEDHQQPKTIHDRER
jgi:hypothetical protein